MGLTPSDLGFVVGAGEGGAGEGNRTLMTSLEGWGSAIELRPRVPVGGVPAPGEHRQRTGFTASRPNRPRMTGQGSVWALASGYGLDLAAMTVAVHAT